MEKLEAKSPMQIKGIPELTFNVNLRLYLEGGDLNGYRIQDLQTDFQQHIDYKGQPQHEVTGGIMTLLLTQITDETINKWMMDSRLLMNGSLVFRQRETTPLVIAFTNAYCVGFNRSMNSISGVCTQLIISPKEIIINKKTHENRWKY